MMINDFNWKEDLGLCMYMSFHTNYPFPTANPINASINSILDMQASRLSLFVARNLNLVDNLPWTVKTIHLDLLNTVIIFQ